MNCGGQGVYLFYLARELARQGHRVDVLVGPPYPAPMPFARSVQELHDDQFWGKWFFSDRRRLLPEPPLRVFEPLRFYELAASRMGFLPAPLAFSARGVWHAASASTWCTTPSAWATGFSACARSGSRS